MTLLTRQDILDAKDRKSIIIEVPEWGGKVKLMTMTGHIRDKYDTSLLGKNGGANLINIRAKLAAACIVDEDGKQQFTEKDILMLTQKSGKALNRVFEAAQTLNHLQDVDVEEQAKN